MATAIAADWSSLPSELLNLVADGLLSTDDIDCYASFRAACHTWRDATVDPRGPDPRFCPRRWVMLNLRAADAQDSRRLFLNVDTGRFVWKDLPVLRDCACAATDDDGLLILRGPSDSNYKEELFSALNPFTGASIRFPLLRTPYASDGRKLAAGSSPAVMLYSFKDQQHGSLANLNSLYGSELIFAAKPALASFASVVCCKGRVYAMDNKGTVAALESRWRITTIVAGDLQLQVAWRPTYLVDNAGELLVVRPPVSRHSLQVFRVDLENKVLTMIKSIGNRAIFLGERPLSVDAGNLPAIEANCVYYVRSGEYNFKGIYMHCLEDGGREKFVEPIDSTLHVIVEDDRQYQLRPLSLVRILMDYANYGEPGDLGAYAPPSFVL